MKKITYEEYLSMLNGWEDDKREKYVYRVPEGKRLVSTSNGEYFLADKVINQIKKGTKECKGKKGSSKE